MIDLCRDIAQGIGRAVALRLADDGYDVAVNDIKGEALAGLVEEIEGKGRKGMWCVADVAVEGEVKEMVESVVGRLGGLDVVSSRCLPFSHVCIDFRGDGGECGGCDLWTGCGE